MSEQNKLSKKKIVASILMPYFAPLILGAHYKGKKGALIGGGVSFFLVLILSAVMPSKEEIEAEKAQKAEQALAIEAKEAGMSIDEYTVAKKAEEQAQLEERKKEKAEIARQAKLNNTLVVEISCDLYGSQIPVGQCFNEGGQVKLTKNNISEAYSDYDMFSRFSRTAVFEMPINEFDLLQVKKGYDTDSLKLTVKAYRAGDKKILFQEEETAPYGRIRLKG